MYVNDVNREQLTLKAFELMIREGKQILEALQLKKIN